MLAPEFSPELDAHDLSRLDRHQIAIRLAVDGVTSAPFTAKTEPPEHSKTRDGRAATIRQASAERYGRPWKRVEVMIRLTLG